MFKVGSIYYEPETDGIFLIKFIEFYDNNISLLIDDGYSVYYNFYSRECLIKLIVDDCEFIGYL